MEQARIIVCEKTGCWAAALRRVLAPDVPPLRQTRSLAECRRELVRAPASMLALELTAENWEAVVAFLSEATWRFPHAEAIVFAARGLEACQWLLREAGAVHVVFSERQLRGAMRLIRRHLEQAPERPCTLRQAIWRRLPWKGRPARAARPEEGTELGSPPPEPS